MNEIIKKISGSESDYVSNFGNFYQKINGKLKSKKTYRSKSGYEYISIRYSFKNYKKKRAHRVVAETFLENPNNYDIVGHKNNIKYDNRAENLYWTTISENTQKAYDDGLASNDIGIDDSQSYPIACYDKNDVLISVYGSIKEAGRCIEGYPSSSIYKVLNNKKVGLKGYRFSQISKDLYFSIPVVKRGVKFKTKKIKKEKHKILITYLNNGKTMICDSQKEAEKITNESQGYISWLVKTGKVSRKNIKYCSLTTIENIDSTDKNAIEEVSRVGN